jgi:hypothetical protein
MAPSHYVFNARLKCDRIIPDTSILIELGWYEVVCFSDFLPFVEKCHGGRIKVNILKTVVTNCCRHGPVQEKLGIFWPVKPTS